MTNPQESNRRAAEVATLLGDLAPLLRSRIRARRGARISHIGTSDIYASVVRRTIEIEQKEGLSAIGPDPAADEPSAERRGLWKLLHLLIDRVVIDAKRRERTEQRVLRAKVSAASAPRPASPAEPVLTTEERDQVRALVESLGEADRDLLFLRLSGREWIEVATQTGSTEAACRQRFHRLTAELARILGGE